MDPEGAGPSDSDKQFSWENTSKESGNVPSPKEETKPDSNKKDAVRPPQADVPIVPQIDTSAANPSGQEAAAPLKKMEFHPVAGGAQDDEEQPSTPGSEPKEEDLRSTQSRDEALKLDEAKKIEGGEKWEEAALIFRNSRQDTDKEHAAILYEFHERFMDAGEVLNSLGKKQEAISMYLRDGSPPAVFAVANIHVGLKEYDQAIQVLEQEAAKGRRESALEAQELIQRIRKLQAPENAQLNKIAEELTEAIKKALELKGEAAAGQADAIAGAGDAAAEQMRRLGLDRGRAKDLPDIPLDNPNLTPEQNDDTREKALQGQREWVWRRMLRVARSRARFGAPENYMDSIEISSNRPFLDKEIAKEIDALIVLYNHYYSLSRGGDLNQCMQEAPAFRDDHFNMYARQLGMSFQVWEREAQVGYNRDQNGNLVRRTSILNVKGQKLRERMDVIQGELQERLKGGWQAQDSAEVQGDLAEFQMMFGEFYWRSWERGAVHDNDRNGTKTDGSAEFALRRIKNMREWARNATNDGRINGKMEVIDRLNISVQDWLSEQGAAFWNSQDKEVIKWYNQMKRTKIMVVEDGRDADGKVVSDGGTIRELGPGEFIWKEIGGRKIKIEGSYKIDEEGNILDLSECPLWLMNFSEAAKTSSTPIMANHINVRLAGAEKTRSFLASPGGQLEVPTIGGLIQFQEKEIFFNHDTYTGNQQAERDQNRKKDWSGDSKVANNEMIIPPLKRYRQEVLSDFADGVLRYELKKKNVDGEMAEHVINQLYAKGAGIVGKKEMKNLMNTAFERSLFGKKIHLPYWLEVPFRKLNKLQGIIAALGEFFKQVAKT